MDSQARLLGYLLGDGGISGVNPRFTNSNQVLRNDFTQALSDIAGCRARLEDSAGSRTPTLCVSSDPVSVAAARGVFSKRLTEGMAASSHTASAVASKLDVSPSLVWQWVHGKSIPGDQTLADLAELLQLEPDQLLANPEGARKNAKNPLTRWLVSLGLWGCGAAEKFVPDVVFRAPRHDVAIFLNRLFATDGWACVLSSGQSQIGYSTVSEKLIRQVQHLLLRFGIIGSLKRRSIRYRDRRRVAWQLDITDARSIQTFIADIGMFGKEEALASITAAVAKRRYQTNRDLIPAGVWRQIAAAKGDLSWSQLSQTLGFPAGHNLHVNTRAVSRGRLTRIADALDSQPLRNLANSDVYWDRIVRVEFLGQQQVYDLTIPQTHNFVANDICVHNTAFAMNLIESISAENMLPTAVFSLEMSKQQLAQRMLCSRGEIDSHKLRRGMLQSHEYAKLATVVGQLAKAPIWVDDSPGLTPLELRAKARRLKLQHDIRAVMIDYMQLMDNPGPDNRQQQISEISRGIKAVARELNVPVIALSQLNRQSEGRDGHRPRMSDLRESGSIEQDADVIMLLHREDYYRMSEPDFQPDNVAEVIIAKQRNGPTGTVKLLFDNRSTRFQNLAAQSDPF